MMPMPDYLPHNYIHFMREESSSSQNNMLSDNRPADPSLINPDGLLLLALQERLNNQLRPNNNQLNNVNNDASRLWQSLMLGLPLMPGINPSIDLNFLQSPPATHPLWQHNLCAWPGCNQPCETITIFIAHLAQAHTSDERATADMRGQVELVDTLEHRLTKERNKLQAMMQHLHMKHSPDTTTPSVGKVEPSSPNPISAPIRMPKQEPVPPPVTVSVAIPTSTPQSQIQITSTAPLNLGECSSVTMTSTDTSPNPDKPFPARRSRITDKTVLPISADISRNREFYRANDVRPPYTYASLIRQAIMESVDCQLTLNEIYTWFTETFAYFRRNAATWKNAVRHNLSLHKCFQRVEQNVKGAVWTVDDSEFYRRRPQRNAATRSQPNTPLPDEVMAQRLIDQTAFSMMDQRSDGQLSSDGLSFNGGLDGVLSFLAASGAGGDQNPLCLLSAAAAASDPSSASHTPAPNLKEEHHSAPDILVGSGREDPDATPPADEDSRLVVDDKPVITTSC